jgi:hypothetical protein
VAAGLTLGIGFSIVRLSFVAGPPGGSAFIGGNSDRVGDESSSQKAGGSCASGGACGAMTSNGRAQWVALKNPALGRGAMCACGVCGRGEVWAASPHVAKIGVGTRISWANSPILGDAGQQELVFRTVWRRGRN